MIRAVWQKTWGLDTLPKLKPLMWRICQGFVAMCERLKDHNVMAKSTCPICFAILARMNQSCMPFSGVIMHLQNGSQGLCDMIIEGPREFIAELLLWIFDRVTKDELWRFLGTLWST